MKKMKLVTCHLPRCVENPPFIQLVYLEQLVIYRFQVRHCQSVYATSVTPALPPSVCTVPDRKSKDLQSFQHQQ